MDVARLISGPLLVDKVLNQAAVAPLICRSYHRDRLAAATRDIKAIATASPNNLDYSVVLGALDVEGIVAFQTVDGDLFDTVETRG